MAKTAPKTRSTTRPYVPPVRPVSPPTRTSAPPATPTERPRNEFIRAADIARTGTNVKLTGVHRVYRGAVDTSVIWEVQIGKGAPAAGQYRDFGLRIGKPDWITAEKQLGKDLSQWAGQVLAVVVAVTPRGDYVNVYDPDYTTHGAAAPATTATTGDDIDDLPF